MLAGQALGYSSHGSWKFLPQMRLGRTRQARGVGFWTAKGRPTGGLGVYVRRDRDLESVAEAERAEQRLRQGLKKSRELVAQYRAKLLALRKGKGGASDRPLFQFDRKR
jgi:hypothetical protein